MGGIFLFSVAGLGSCIRTRRRCHRLCDATVTFFAAVNTVETVTNIAKPAVPLTTRHTLEGILTPSYGLISVLLSLLLCPPERCFTVPAHHSGCASNPGVPLVTGQPLVPPLTATLRGGTITPGLSELIFVALGAIKTTAFYTRALARDGPGIAVTVNTFLALERPRASADCFRPVRIDFLLREHRPSLRKRRVLAPPFRAD